MTEEKLMEKIKDITREAGEIMLTAVHPKVMEKGGHANFVTETDKKIQAFLRDRPDRRNFQFYVFLPPLSDLCRPPQRWKTLHGGHL